MVLRKPEYLVSPASEVNASDQFHFYSAGLVNNNVCGKRNIPLAVVTELKHLGIGSGDNVVSK